MLASLYFQGREYEPVAALYLSAIWRWAVHSPYPESVAQVAPSLSEIGDARSAVCFAGRRVAEISGRLGPRSWRIRWCPPVPDVKDCREAKLRLDNVDASGKFESYRGSQPSSLFSGFPTLLLQLAVLIANEAPEWTRTLLGAGCFTSA